MAPGEDQGRHGSQRRGRESGAAARRGVDVRAPSVGTGGPLRSSNDRSRWGQVEGRGRPRRIEGARDRRAEQASLPTPGARGSRGRSRPALRGAAPVTPPRAVVALPQDANRSNCPQRRRLSSEIEGSQRVRRGVRAVARSDGAARRRGRVTRLAGAVRGGPTRARAPDPGRVRRPDRKQRSTGFRTHRVSQVFAGERFAHQARAPGTGLAPSGRAPRSVRRSPPAHPDRPRSRTDPC